MPDFSPELILATLSLFVPYWIFIRQRSSSVDKERLVSIISPCYEIIYPVIFCSVDELRVKKALEEARRLIDACPLLSGGVIRACFEDILAPDQLTQENYDRLCYTLDSEYSKLCRQVGIPVRPWDDKWRKRKLGRSWTLLFRVLIHTLPIVAAHLAMAAIAFFAFLTVIYLFLLNTGLLVFFEKNQEIVTLIFMLVFGMISLIASNKK